VNQKSTLTNGLRVVTEEVAHFYSVSVGIWLNVGSRDEAEAENGLTHFLEHMAFKGTGRRSALQIARETDRIGGTLNAFTTKESTCFHGKVLAAQLPRLVDLLGDLVTDPRCEAQDLERERQVILEEIGSQEDNPEELAQVLFERQFWGDTPLGRPILGLPPVITGVSLNELGDYRGAHYRPETTVVAASGRVSHQELVDLIAPHFEKISNQLPPGPRNGVSVHPGIYASRRDLEQVTLCLGTEAPAAGDWRRYAITLLNLILGGNMSSRLFQAIREDLGLAYMIYSSVRFLSDTGLMSVHAQVGPENLDAVIEALSRELRKLKSEGIPPEELDAAQDYLEASIYLHAEDADDRMTRLARNEIQFGRYIPYDELIANLRAVTIEEIQAEARELLKAENWGMTLLGPVGEDSLTLDF